MSSDNNKSRNYVPHKYYRHSHIIPFARELRPYVEIHFPPYLICLPHIYRHNDKIMSLRNLAYNKYINNSEYFLKSNHYQKNIIFQILEDYKKYVYRCSYCLLVHCDLENLYYCPYFKKENYEIYLNVFNQMKGEFKNNS